METLHLLEAVQFCMKSHWGGSWIWSDVMPQQCCLEEKKMSSATKSSDGTPSLTGRVTALPL